MAVEQLSRRAGNSTAVTGGAKVVEAISRQGGLSGYLGQHVLNPLLNPIGFLSSAWVVTVAIPKLSEYVTKPALRFLHQMGLIRLPWSDADIAFFYNNQLQQTNSMALDSPVSGAEAWSRRMVFAIGTCSATDSP